MNEMPTTSQKKGENPLLNIGINIILPSLILTKFSKPEYLGQVMGLIVALSLPIGYGLYELLAKKRKNVFSLLGLLSVVLTGGIGLLSLDKQWMVLKETAIPFIMGIVVIASQYTNYPLVKLFFDQMINLAMIEEEYRKVGNSNGLNPLLHRSSWLLGSTFFISAALNFYLAETILQGRPGSVEFNESLGKMTALSFPVISLPMMVMMVAILFYIFHHIKKHTQLELEAILKQQ